MRFLELHGKHAVGDHRFAIVDGDLFDFLNQWKWKAKPNANGTHVYAVRNELAADGRCVTVRMHRVVLDYADPLDVDHRNRMSLDNRKGNLRILTRSANIKNTAEHSVSGTCKQCGEGFVRMVVLGVSRLSYCSDRCSNQAAVVKARKSLNAKRLAARTGLICGQCGDTFIGRKRTQTYCSGSCKSKAKWVRMKIEGVFPPSVLLNAARCKAWRDAKRAR